MSKRMSLTEATQLALQGKLKLKESLEVEIDDNDVIEIETETKKVTIENNNEEEAEVVEITDIIETVPFEIETCEEEIDSQNEEMEDAEVIEVIEIMEPAEGIEIIEIEEPAQELIEEPIEEPIEDEENILEENVCISKKQESVESDIEKAKDLILKMEETSMPYKGESRRQIIKNLKELGIEDKNERFNLAIIIKEIEKDNDSKKEERFLGASEDTINDSISKGLYSENKKTESIDHMLDLVYNIKFNVSGAAFEDNGQKEFQDVFNKLALEIANGDVSGKIMDSYGNTCIEYTSEEELFESKNRRKKVTESDEDVQDITWIFDSYVELDYTPEKDSYSTLVKTEKELDRFNFHSDYWGSEDEYREENERLFEDVKEYIGKKVVFHTDDGKVIFTLEGLLIDKQYNDVAHTKIYAKDMEEIEEVKKINEVKEEEILKSDYNSFEKQIESFMKETYKKVESVKIDKIFYKEKGIKLEGVAKLENNKKSSFNLELIKLRENKYLALENKKLKLENNLKSKRLNLTTKLENNILKCTSLIMK